AGGLRRHRPRRAHLGAADDGAWQRFASGGQPGGSSGAGPGTGGRGRSSTGRSCGLGAHHTARSTMTFTHLDESGQARMVDVTEKQPTVRSATATGLVRCAEHVVAALREGSVPKGDVLAVARVAGIAGAKRTPQLLPLAHVIGVHGAALDAEVTDEGVALTATVRTADRTGVEMEALTAVSIAALNVVDMVKGLDKATSIEQVRLIRQTGGKPGAWPRPRHPSHRPRCPVALLPRRPAAPPPLLNPINRPSGRLIVLRDIERLEDVSNRLWAASGRV